MSLDGYIKLYRKLIGSVVFKNEGLLKVWIWCLLKATHVDRWVKMKTGKSHIEILIRPGQFIFGRDRAAEQLDMKPSTVWKRINKLKKLQKCDIDSDRQYSIITIINWDSYQGVLENSDSERNRQGTGKEQARNTDKNVKNVKNKNNNPPLVPPSSKKAGKRKIQSDFELTEKMRTWFQKQNFQNIDIESATCQFIDYWLSNGEMKSDWEATWRNGMRLQNKWAEKQRINMHDNNVAAAWAFLEDYDEHQ